MNDLHGVSRLRSPVLRRRLLALAAVGWLATAAGPTSAQAEAGLQASEYQVKAAFICKFASYVEWPPGDRADQPFVIGVLGSDEVAQELTRAAAGMSVQGRSMVVRKLPRPEALAGVHILFIARSHGGRLAELLASARGQPLLTVTETEPASTAGSIINFVLVDDKVRFDIALPLAEQGNLKISARLLGVARKVWTKTS
ncbi:YfiR family protein [Aquincola sp. S2]|uniref:YfiR family protein n=1 Tax=Pseudaquabacterium terrae TaxID=2732868 RepID=A0ABX2EBG3_9BURK|nr:YfiR family protein [Aquabacterium terrae]NRF66474.1 YfiR family protein [Aquabacterium terrae]